MKTSLSTFLLLFCFELALGQLRYGTYKISSDTVDYGLGTNFSTLVVRNDTTFTFEYRTTTSCFLWYNVNGKWKIQNDNLVLTDSVYSFHPVVEFTKNKSITDKHISILVTTKDKEPIKGVKINYLFKNSKDTLSGKTDSRGQLTIDTKNMLQRKDSRVIDDIEIWTVHFDGKGQEWTTNTFSTLSADIECVIDKDAVDELVVRTTEFKIDNEELVYISQTFSKADSRPNQHLSGNFRLEKE